ncbi:hypothetical protein [Algoriphagus limi]|uniref:Uncharacterized protein n=1 Tax=Algoriphagus limi TaxID=2975273 RepID=A0ABT2GAR0_9BACT|nr:hypothetical protein [Algoriphagus limi]MCS5491032.1 hypothetical protein [Algoriphagus limi]
MENRITKSSYRLFKNRGLVFFLLFILFFASHVSLAQKKKKASVGPAGGTIELSPLELRETMNDFFYKFSRTITESADNIIRLSSNPGIDQEALIWKINAIPIANEAIYSRDPFLGYIDLAVFTYQMKQYFENGAGKELFGDHQNIAINAVDSLWEDLLDIGRNLVPDNDISEGTQLVIDFAKQNPLRSSYFVRQSTIPLMTKIQNVEKVTFKALAVDMAQSIDDLRSQISSYMEVLPKQVRWESEYLINQALKSPELSSRLDSLADLLERTVLVIESSNELIDNQREAAFEDIRGERIAVIQALRREREIILAEIKNEREIILAELFEQLTIQREATIQDLTALTNQSIEMTFVRMEEIVDKLYWRTVTLLAVLVVLIFLGMIVYKKI